MPGSRSRLPGATIGGRPMLPPVTPTTAALVLLLIVLATAARARLSVALAVAIAATLVLNYFFLPPIGTFVIADPQNWVALVVFLIVAVLASNLSAAMQARARDAIERAQLLRERDAAALVQQKAELTATMLAALSHDLRTPLTTIRVAIENLQGELSPEERSTQALAAGKEVDRLTRLFRDILDMARIDANAVRLEREWVSPGDVVDAAVAYVQPQLGSHPLQVRADEFRQCHIDPRLASVALSHVLENAALYSPAGGVITVVATAEPAGLSVSVSDEGPGIAPSERDRVFEPFFRGHRAEQSGPSGTGLGLALTRGLLSAAGGHVVADNIPGAGARVSIQVPGAVRATPEVA